MVIEDDVVYLNDEFSLFLAKIAEKIPYFRNCPGEYKAIKNKKMSQKAFNNICQEINDYINEFIVKMFKENNVNKYVSADVINSFKKLINIFKENYKDVDLSSSHEYITFINYCGEIIDADKNIWMERDLNKAKDEIIINFKYFLSPDEIDYFEQLYSNASKEHDLTKMREMLEYAQSLILDQWKMEISSDSIKNSKDFKFIGHSLRDIDFSGDFKTRYISCSLFTQDLYDVFNSPFGFVFAPENIKGASCHDLQVTNNASNDEEILFHSTVPIIDHPKRVIEEEQADKKENDLNNSKRKVYSEVVIDGFNPIAIFYFNLGALSFEPDYEKVIKLSKNYPNLKVLSFNVLENKKNPTSDYMKVKLITNLKNKLFHLKDGIYYNEAIEKYEYFFEELALLQKQEKYNEDDIIKIFKTNYDLVSVVSILSIDEIFTDKYDDKMRKQYLGYNPDYSISDLFNDNKIYGYKLNKIKGLMKYYGQLDKYYAGLDNLVWMLDKIEIDNILVEEINNLKNKNINSLTKFIAEKIKSNNNNLSKSIDKDQLEYDNLNNKIEFLMNQKAIKEQYSELVKNKSLFLKIKKDFENINNDIQNSEEVIQKTSLSVEELNTKIFELENYINNSEDKKYQKQEKNIKFYVLVNNIFSPNKKYKIVQKYDDINNKKKILRDLYDQLSSYLSLISTCEDNLEVNNKMRLFYENKLKEMFNCSNIDELTSKFEQAEEFLINEYDYESELAYAKETLLKIKQRMLENKANIINETEITTKIDFINEETTYELDDIKKNR